MVLQRGLLDRPSSPAIKRGDAPLAVACACRESPAGAAARPPGQSEAEAVRVRCRLAVLMQRAYDAIHARCCQHMPLPVQLQLLAVLQARLTAPCCLNDPVCSRIAMSVRALCSACPWRCSSACSGDCWSREIS